jgi:biopolymer transport protein ExbD
MAMSIGPSDGGEDEVVSAINTTPLVDVMLVLLIIFLITIPAITHTVPVKLPEDRNQPTQTKPENIIIAVDRDGDYFWNNQSVPDIATLQKKLDAIAVIVPQPEVHIRGDQDGKYEAIGKVVEALQRASIGKVAFITQPPPKGG